ncbi:MAG: ATP-binding protein [Candidatus Buchananbacteria bacterium]|nr:ATP-binding protein [Candidatus Buchananbacteria bacterium]
MTESKKISEELLKVLNDQSRAIVGITGSPSNTLDIEIDITETSKSDRVLGQMVYVVVEEDNRKVLVIGQIIKIETKNRWHEDMAFKGVIKRHGKLPHLSGAADNRLAKISVQACYDLGGSEPRTHILGTSPSTGEKVQKMDNEVMKKLMENHGESVTYIGKVYGTDVNLPFWFKHFDKTLSGELGAKDAYHIGIFGKTGSGKTVTAAMALLGYAKNKNNMNILVLDPQGQFYVDNELLPNDKKLEQAVGDIGMKYKKFKILEDLYLPGNAFDLFGNLLLKSGFVSKSFNILSDREVNAADAISEYLESYNKKSKGKSANLTKLSDEGYSLDLMKKTLQKFTEVTEDASGKKSYSRYLDMIYSDGRRKDQVIGKLNSVLSNETYIKNLFDRRWSPVAKLFAQVKNDGTNKITVNEIIDLVSSETDKGNFVVLDMSERGGSEISENLQALFVKMVQEGLMEKGEDFYTKDKKVNCLVVMDEAHRFISHASSDLQIVELTKDIIDAVRTTRKFGIGYMFITQTIESLDEEILRQMRIFGFGYGLTSGSELRTVGEIINNPSAIQLYRSFIDPSSNGKFPFMFFGPISPLSFTGSPLFLEVFTDYGMFETVNGVTSNTDAGGKPEESKNVESS